MGMIYKGKFWGPTLVYFNLYIGIFFGGAYLHSSLDNSFLPRQ